MQVTAWLARKELSIWRVTAARPGLHFSSALSPVPPQALIAIRPCYYSTKPSPLPEYGYIHGVENVGNYRPGGYHPVHISDRLKDRYKIIHKLGHGTFSTAWLALDEKLSRYVAIKIGIAHANCTEANILSQLAPNTIHHTNAGVSLPQIPIVLDRFEISGPNGIHPCLVTLPARCSLQEAKEASGCALLQLDVARSLSAQLVLAFSLVHSRGYAHGDLHLGNLLLQLPSSLDRLSVEQIYARYGEPELESVVRLDSQAISKAPGVPSYVVPPIWLGIPSDAITLSQASMILNDFGVAFRPEERSQRKSHTPSVLRCPEASFEPTTPLTLKSDIWSMGCVIFELLAQRSLIDGFLAPEDEITAQQVELQGMMPPKWWRSWKKRSKWYDAAGRALSSPSDVWSWERRFEQWVQSPRRSKNMGTIGRDEQDALFKLLKWMLAWTPEERPEARQALETDWMTRWSSPAYRKGLAEHVSMLSGLGSPLEP